MEVGATVDPETPLADGQKAYALPDGTFVVVDRALPLPEAVQADLHARGAAVVAAHPDGTVDSNASVKAIAAFEGDVVRDAGKRPLVIWHIFGYPTPDDSEKVFFYSISGGPVNGSTYYTDRAEVEAIVNSYMSDPENAAKYAVVWTD